MDNIFYKLRELLKKISIANRVNSILKARQLRHDLALLRDKYTRLAHDQEISYQEENALTSAKQSIGATQKKGSRSNTGRLKVFWVGANLDQDMSGFLQALQRICDVVCFINAKGTYGLWYADDQGRIQVYDRNIIALNDEALIQQVEEIKRTGGLDLLMGQMWSNYISPRALNHVRSLGIPVINISMDDKLPDNWKFVENGYRLGSVGLVDAMDLVLTTTTEACLWYEAEGCPALFWPLASDPNVFYPPISEDNRDIDVLFIGNRYGIREKIVNYLVKSEINIDCWGGGWPNGYATAEQSASLFRRAKIVLGIGTVGYCDDIFTLKLRDFDAPMSGALYITHRNPDLIDLYKEGVEIECYENERECAEKISFYLEHPNKRAAVANAGRAKALSRDSWDQRISSTLDMLNLLRNE